MISRLLWNLTGCIWRPKPLVLAETVNSQAPPTHSSSIMHDFADCGYIPRNYIFFRLKSPCIVSYPMFGSLSTLLIIFAIPSWTLASHVRLMKTRPADRTEVLVAPQEHPPAAHSSPWLNLCSTPNNFSLYCCWADVFMEIVIMTPKCYSWAVMVSSLPAMCISLSPNILNTSTYPHAYIHWYI